MNLFDWHPVPRAWSPPCGSTRSTLRSAALVVLCAATTSPVSAQIRTDSSLGHPAQSLTGPNYAIPQSLGLLSGANLFQSFSIFNLARGESANFTTSTAGIANIISRVTGGTASTLEGVLNVTAASGAPNFFFINPAGVTFGGGATVNVPAALHISTANYLKFADGRFYSDLGHVSTFSAMAPEAFGFLGTTRATLTVGNDTFLDQANAPISLVGGDVVVDNSAVFTSGPGDIRIAAVGGDVVEVPFTGNLPAVHGGLTISNGAEIGTSATIQNGGNILVSAGTISIDSKGSIYETGLFADAPGGSTGNAGTIQVTATGGLSMVNLGIIASTTESSGSSGAVSVNVSGPMSVTSGAAIFSQSSATGNAGPIQIAVAQGLGITSGAEIYSQSLASGNSGAIQLHAGSLNIDGSNANGSYTGIYTDTPAGSGTGGAITIALSGPMGLVNTGSIAATSESAGNAGSISISTTGPMSLASGAQIYSDAASSGNAGSVSVQTTSMSIDGSAASPPAGIFSTAHSGTGNAGTVDIAATGSISLVNFGFISGSTYTTGAGGDVSVSALGNLTVSNGASIGSDSNGVSGVAGNVNVSAANIALLGSAGTFTGISSDSQSALSGPAGRITVTTPGALSIVGGADINSITASSADAGAIQVKAGSLSINGEGVALQTGISTNTEQAEGNAGSINVAVAGLLSIVDGGGISSDSQLSSGNAGPVQVSAGSLYINGDGHTIAGISSSMFATSSAARGGDVRVTVAGDATILDGGQISADTFLLGNAGSVDFSAANILINANELRITTGVTSISDPQPGLQAGNAGTVRVHASDSLLIENGGSISTSTNSPTGRAGDVLVTAEDILVTGFLSSIDAESLFYGLGQAGNVTVEAGNSITLSNRGELSITNAGLAPNTAGFTPTLLSVTAPEITLSSDAQITALALGRTAASNIRIQFGSELLLDPSAISTDAYDGNGGSITIRGNGVLDLSQSEITTSVFGPSGNGGNISINAGALVLNSGFIQANTVAAKATGGNVSIDVAALVPSGSNLFVGGSTPYEFEPDVFGFNVIQAAAPTGLSGTVQITNPALNLSASLSVLAEKFLSDGNLGHDRCHGGAGSSLAEGGRGGFAPSARDLVRADPLASGSSVAQQGPKADLVAWNVECAH